MPRKRIEDPQVRRRQILTGAQTVLRKKRYHELVMDDIARAAGLSKGLLYLYFKDKEQLFAAVARDLLEQVHARIADLKPAGSPLGDLEAMIRVLLVFSEEHQEFVSQFIGEQLMAGHHAPMILKAYEAYLGDMATRLDACVRKGVLRPHDKNMSADILMDLVTLYTRHKFLMKTISRPLAECAPEITSTFLNGFGRPGAGR
jgi:AcrR family transcriptional regulator